MIEFGKTLRTAREAKGLTTAQVAEATHMMPQVVEGLEKEDFSRIVAPIYGRGFVRLYCEAVGIDSQPLLDTFMAPAPMRNPRLRFRSRYFRSQTGRKVLSLDTSSGMEGSMALPRLLSLLQGRSAVRCRSAGRTTRSVLLDTGR